ncbi:type II toxin-antitoxin system PemK/MazF family toxin [Nonlabens agnitus]|uniref:mRNA interferase n=1 Tax=Nonlabens agnitus TaxID=870484 RepID=A0A2S9WUD2_9FLAO|nr:type II toxin-antitoxin system PemK/MazF family toxin [Nonlabens agnitus]PRP67083.1 transcription elongation factor GreAB [Nonlabens agnitus]
MKQNDIYEAYLDPVVGSEQGGRRPVVIVSGNLINENAANILTCPLTSSLKYYEGNPILEPTRSNGLGKTSEVMVFQIRSVSKERLKRKIGKISNQQMDQIKQTLVKLMNY